MRDDPIPKDWFWEGNVQKAIARQLRRDGWRIERMANAAWRRQGEDILATRDGRTLMVEVKGYPSTAYRDPRRAGETKLTAPTLQAGHWFGGAILDYVGVIIGPDLVRRPMDGGWVGQRHEFRDRIVSRGVTDAEFTAFVKSTYRVLLTRGLRGCCVYFMDATTRDFVLSRTERAPEIQDVRQHRDVGFAG